MFGRITVAGLLGDLGVDGRINTEVGLKEIGCKRIGLSWSKIMFSGSPL
jgi:hypothetical protein